MQGNKFYRIAAMLIVGLSVGLSGCKPTATPESAAATGGAASKRVPTGVYQSPMPDGSVIRLTFGEGNAVEIAMTEAGETNSFDGEWVLNGEVIILRGGEGMAMQLAWRGDELITDFGGIILTFTEV
jgi:hypothetical protein